MSNDILINKAFDDLMQNLRIGTSDDDKERIRKAFIVAREAHKGVARKSGEPYILHPIAVAKIAAKEIGLGTTSVISALLHDVVEDTDTTVENIQTLFGEKVARIVDGLTKIQVVMEGDTTKQAESFRKILLTLNDDIRVVLVKIADRLHNMRTLDSMPEYKQIKISGETLYIYAPLAYKMGLHAIKTELEDLCLRYEHPNEYFVLNEKIKDYENKNVHIYSRFIAPIKANMDDRGYDFSISYRTKSVYSVWSKMQRKNISFDDIYDILAVRIVFKSVEGSIDGDECWKIFNIIGRLYRQHPDRIRNWINEPRATGYRALHSTFMFKGSGEERGEWIEVQIRSERMDEIAEKGLAAHWKYKSNDDSGNEIDKWLSGVKSMLDEPDVNALEFLDRFKLNLYNKEIRVFTPKGSMKILPKGATVLDLAYEIHTEIGDACIGAKVNRSLVSRTHKLNSGDQVEVLTASKSIVERDWINCVITSKAKSHIINIFKNYRRDLIRNGINRFDKILKHLDMPSASEALKKCLTHFEITSKDNFYLMLAESKISAEEIEKLLKKNSTGRFVKYLIPNFLGGKKNKINDNELEEDKFVIAACCNPIIGDDVIGIDNENLGVEVHKRSCPMGIEHMAKNGDKIVEVKWISKKLISSEVVVNVKGIDSIGVVSDITTITSKHSKLNLRKINFEAKDGIFEGQLNIYVNNTEDLNNLIKEISSLKGVESIGRNSDAKIK